MNLLHHVIAQCSGEYYEGYICGRSFATSKDYKDRYDVCVTQGERKGLIISNLSATEIQYKPLPCESIDARPILVKG